MERYKIITAVWRNGSGWQPHNIADRTADTLAEAELIAQQIVAIGAQLGDPIVYIFDGDNPVKEIGWK